MLNVDQQPNWLRDDSWDIPPYRSGAFFEWLENNFMTLGEFKRSPMYERAVEEGLIVDDEWAGPVEKGGPGSGNWGHEGMPGVWGGGQEGGGSEDFRELSPAARHACDPETAEFDEERFLRYTEDMTEEEYQDYLEKLEEDLGELEPTVPDEPAPEPGEFKTAAQAEQWLKSEYNIEADFEMTPERLEDYAEDPEKVAELQELAEEAGMHFTDFVREGKMSLDMEFLNENLKQFEKVAEKYPAVGERLQYMGTLTDMDKAPEDIKETTALGDYDEGYWDANENTFAMVGGHGQYMGLNPNYWGNPEEFKESIDDTMESGYHPSPLDDPYESVMTHECGHVLHYAMMEGQQYAGRYAQEYTDSGGVSYVNDTSIHALADGYSRTLHADLADEDSLSRYSEKNQNEAFAETFTALEHGTGELAESAPVQSMEKFMQDAREDYYTADEVTDIDDMPDDTHEQIQEKLEATEEIDSIRDVYIDPFDSEVAEEREEQMRRRGLID